MPIMNKKEWKIFFSLLLIYSIFAGYGGWNENALLSLSFSLGLDNKLSIDKYVDHPIFYTIDKGQYNGHYYSPNAPGLPIFTAGYIKFLGLLFGDNILETPWKMFIIIYFCVVFSSGIATAGTAVIIYKISKRIVGQETISVLLTFVYGLGTSAFLYATRFRSHALATFLLFFSFYIIFTEKERISKKQLLLIGLCLGWAVITDLPTIVIAICLIILTISYINMHKSSRIPTLALGFLIPLCVYFLLNYLRFQNILSIGFAGMDPNVWTNNVEDLIYSPYMVMKLLVDFSIINLTKLLEYAIIIIRNLIQLLFLPYRGLFFYSPILFLSVLGISSFYKKYRKEAILIFFFVLALIIFVAGYSTWWCHGGASCRRFLPFTPFLFILIMCTVRKINYKLLMTLSVLSIFFNFFTIQAYESLGGFPYGISETIYRITIVQFFDFIANPLFEHYLPLFLIFGPKSILLERILGFSLPAFLNLLFVGFFLLVIWFKELKKYFIQHKKICIMVGLLFLILISVRIIFGEPIKQYAKEQYIEYYLDKPVESSQKTNEELSFIHPKYFYEKYQERMVFNIPYIMKLPSDLISLNENNRNWYIPQVYPATQHNRTSMYDNATINLFSNDTKPKTYDLSIFLYSFYKNRALHIYVNNELLNQYNIEYDKGFEITENILLRPGMNQFRFISNNGCSYVYEARGGTDTNMQCISFRIYRLEIS